MIDIALMISSVVFPGNPGEIYTEVPHRISLSVPPGISAQEFIRVFPKLFPEFLVGFRSEFL